MALGLLALPGLLLAPSGVPLDADVFDASALPAVVIDIVPRRDFAAVDLTAPMVQISGGTVQSVTKVDPASVAVGLVIDDGPTVAAAAINDFQGASVELVRLAGDGTQISLSTPSGLQTAPTTDEDASLARLAGIVAGSPDVISLPNLVLDAAQRLAASPLRDRHLVVALGTTFPDGAAVQAVRDVIIPAGIRLDVVAAAGLDPGGLDDLSVESGGISPVVPKPTGEMDAIIRAIRDRYHVAATVDGPGAHEVTLNVGGQAFSASVDVVGAPAVPGTASTPTTANTPTTVAAPSATQTPTTVGAAAATPRASPTTVAAPTTAAPSTDDATSSGMSRGARILIVLLALVAAAAFGTFFVLSQRAKRSAKLRRERAALAATQDGEADGAAHETSPDASSAWDRPPEDPVDVVTEADGDGPLAAEIAADAAAATTIAGTSPRRRRRRSDPQPSTHEEPAAAAEAEAEPAPMPEPMLEPDVVDVHVEAPVVPVVAAASAAAAASRRRRRRDVEAEPATVDAPEAPVVAEEPEPDAIHEPTAAADADVDVTDDAVAAAELGVATTRPMSAKAARRARQKARRQPGGLKAADVADHDDGVEVVDEVDMVDAVDEPAAPEPVVEVESVVVVAPVEPEPVAEVEPVVVVVPPEPEPEPVAEPALEPVDDAGSAIIEPVADVEVDPLPFTAAVTRTRGRSLNDRPRRVSSRRPVEATPEPAEVDEPPEDATPRRGRRRGDSAERPPPERTRARFARRSAQAGADASTIRQHPVDRRHAAAPANGRHGHRRGLVDERRPPDAAVHGTGDLARP